MEISQNREVKMIDDYQSILAFSVCVRRKSLVKLANKGILEVLVDARSPWLVVQIIS